MVLSAPTFYAGNVHFRRILSTTLKGKANTDQSPNKKTVCFVVLVWEMEMRFVESGNSQKPRALLASRFVPGTHSCARFRGSVPRDLRMGFLYPVQRAGCQ